MTKFAWTLSMLLTLAGVGLGLRTAYAEGDGCRTYLQMYPVPPTYFCVESECNTSPQKCLFVSAPYPECACNGNPQIPFCELDWTVDPIHGYQAVCNRLLCPLPAKCEVEFIGLTAYCDCQ